MQAAVIGGGVIGGGWVARFLLMGHDVNVYDPDPESQRKLEAVIANAKRSLPGLYEHSLPRAGQLKFCTSLPEAVQSADWITEAVPERLELKQAVFSEIQSACRSDAVIASSTSGFRPSELQADAVRPEQIIVAHPFNPVYLIPLVELVGDQSVLQGAAKVLEHIGMLPLIVRKEIDAHIADRLLEAVWREGLWLINDDVATTQEIDDAIRYGFGLRWAQMGLFETYRIAGGEAGMAHFIEQFGPALQWPWTKLMDVPELTEELVQKIADQSDQQSGRYSIRELEKIRDDNLVAMMRALKGQNWGAGELLNKVDLALAEAPVASQQSLPITIKRVIPSDWSDYNGHMNDSRYGDVFSVAADQMMKLVGADESYIESGKSYFTLDLQISFLQECHAGDEVEVQSKIQDAQGKKLWLEHQLTSNDGSLLATATQLLIHVDLELRRSSEPDVVIAQKLSQLQTWHNNLDFDGGRDQ